jgi:hypothetical protein
MMAAWRIGWLTQRGRVEKSGERFYLAGSEVFAIVSFRFIQQKSRS